MNWIDISILVIIGFSAIKGIREGLIRQVAFFVAIYVGIFASGYLTAFVEKGLVDFLSISPKSAHTVGLALSFVLILVFVSWIGRLLSKAISPTPLALFNRLGGLLLGILIPLTVLSYLFLFIDSIVFPENPSLIHAQKREEKTDIRHKSLFYDPIKRIVPTFITPRLLDKEKELMEKYNDSTINENK